MGLKLNIQPGIMGVKPYVGGISKIAGNANAIKLSANENPLGPSQKAVMAYQIEAAHMHRYPSENHAALRDLIGQTYHLDAGRILMGCGSDEIISFLCRAFAGVGDEVLYTEHGFGMYQISARLSGATPVSVLENTRVTDVDALLGACTKNTRLVFVANPNNPTGTMTPDAEIARLADGLPEGCLLVLDGAYAEYVYGFDGGASFVESRDNVVMTRTFSKIFGLGGLRIGWGYGPDNVMDVLARLKGPFNVSAPALAAAKAALEDKAYTEFCRAENEKWRGWLAAELEKIGIPSDPSFANFILARFTSADEAAAADAHLKDNGLIVRRVANYNLPEALRITVGDETACRQLVTALTEFKVKQ
ncbi:MAG: histidinol-phosphate transaminase [Rhodobacterales bacterium]